MASIRETSTYTPDIYEISITDPIQGGEDGITNIQPKQLANRTRYLKDSLEAEHTPDGAHSIMDSMVAEDAGISESKINWVHSPADLDNLITGLQGQVDNLTAGSGSYNNIVAKQKLYEQALSMKNTISPEKYFFELFQEPNIYHDEIEIGGVMTTSGDESVDLASTSQLVIGREYVIVDGDVKREVTVAEILSSTRFRATENLDYSFNGATLNRSTVTPVVKGTVFRPYDHYYMDPIYLDNADVTKQFCLRRRDTAEKIYTYYKDETQPEWQLATKQYQVVSADRIGYRDEIYALGTGETVEIKLVADANNTKTLSIAHCILFVVPSLKKSPLVEAPVNVSPADRSPGQNDGLTLEGSAYKTLYDVAQAASEFQIATDSEFSVVIHTETGTGTSVTLPTGILGIDTVYYWRCRYQDADGVWSDWSEGFSFSTASTFEYIAQPTAVSPSDGSVDFNSNGTLQASPFTVVNTTDTHASSQWQVATDSAFTDILWDTGTDTTNLESVSLAGAGLDMLTHYYWRVRYNGTVLGWSAWSVGAGFVTTDMIQGVEVAKLLASDGETNDYFGYSVSMSADGATAIVGAYGEDQRGSNAGAAYIFTNTSGTWTQVAKITASDAQASDNFGYSVSMSADGATAIVGAYGEDQLGTDAGAAYIFTNTSGTWTQVAKITASDAQASDNFGWSVSMSADGTTAIVGANLEDQRGSNAGAAYIFTNTSGTWTQVAKITASDGEGSDFFGASVSMSADGATAIVGAYREDQLGTDAGAAYIFTNTSGTWTQVTKITASDGATTAYFGWSVSMSADGTTAIVGARYEDQLGNNAGAAYIFTNTSGTWTQVAKITASDGEANDNFGWSVSMSADGTTAIVGAYQEDQRGDNAGAAYIFTNTSGTWTQVAKITASDAQADDNFGWSVSMSADGTTAIVGAYREDQLGTDAGAAYIFN